MNLMFGIVTFIISILLLICDLIGFIRNKFDFKSIKDGKVEGFTLLLFVLWWIAGTASMTRAGALAYEALNVWFSAWDSLFACVHALDMWGGEKEMLTINKLTRLSITLPAWWVVCLSSIVTVGSAADATRIVKTPDAMKSCAFAVAVGVVSAAVSAFFILSHYEFLQCCEACSLWLTYGGWLELVCSILVNLWHVVGLDRLTSAGQIASTIVGSGTNPDSYGYVPGSNIYASIWISFISSVLVTVKWKEARAIKFAQTSEGQTNEEEELGLGKDNEGIDGDEEDI